MPTRTQSPALFAFLAGGLSIAVLILGLLPPPADASQQLEFASSHWTAYALFASLVLAWSVFSIPFVVVLGTLLRSANRLLASSAQLLTVAGLLLLGFGIFMHIGAVLSVVSAGPAPSADIAAYQLKFWSHLGFILTDPGLMALGFGQLLFGWLSWRSHALPGWISVIGLVGGAAGLLTLAVYQTPVLALMQLLCFAVWGFAVGFKIIRSPQIAALAQAEA